jgi:maspardin
MASKIKWIVLVIVLLVLVVIYIIPGQKQSFADLSSSVPENQRLLYQGFTNQFKAHRMLINGAGWEYIVAGPDAETILFLHGMAGAYDIWWQQIIALRQDFRIISVTYPPVDNLEELSQGVLQIMDSQNVQRANIVGTSLGGYLAQYLVAAHPERITRVVFSNTCPPNNLIRENYAVVGVALPFLPEWAIMQTLRSSMEDIVFPAAGGDEFTRAYLLSIVSGRMTKAQVVARYQVVIEPFTPVDPLDQGIAVMIIESDNDPLISEELREQLKETYPLSFKHTFENAGHFPYLNYPEDYTNLLLRFFNTPIME